MFMNGLFQPELPPSPLMFVARPVVLEEMDSLMENVVVSVHDYKVPLQSHLVRF
jgi:hypothetical protein